VPMGCRILMQISLIVACIVGAVAWGEETRRFINGSPYFSTAGLASYPTFVFGNSVFQLPDARPVESSVQFHLAERTLRLKTSYFEKNFPQDPLDGENRRRRVMSIVGTSDLVGDLLKSETGFAYNPFSPGMFAGPGAEIPTMFRFGVKGKWQGYQYGAEYRSSDKDFMNLKGSEARRSEKASRIWGERAFGPVRVNMALSQLWTNVNEISNQRRVTRRTSASVHLKKSNWDTKISSHYQLRKDRFLDGKTVEEMSQELRTSYKPVDFLKISPRFKLREEWDRTSGVRTENPLVSLSFTLKSRREILNITGSTSYGWTRSSDRLTNARNFWSKAKLIWNLRRSFRGVEKRLSLEVSYRNKVDLISRGNSGDDFSAKVLFTVFSF
jgi:hypothetical protein